jgi:hypothetical protein
VGGVGGGLFVTRGHRPPATPPLSPLERWSFDYSELGRWMARSDSAIRSTRRVLDNLCSLRTAKSIRLCGVVWQRRVAGRAARASIEAVELTEG